MKRILPRRNTTHHHQPACAPLHLCTQNSMHSYASLQLQGDLQNSSTCEPTASNAKKQCQMPCNSESGTYHCYVNTCNQLLEKEVEYLDLLRPLPSAAGITLTTQAPRMFFISVPSTLLTASSMSSREANIALPFPRRSTYTQHASYNCLAAVHRNVLVTALSGLLH